MKRILLVIFATLILVIPLSAKGGPHQLELHTLVGGEIQDPVEQQSDYPYDPAAERYVVNPTTSCFWDVDDHWLWSDMDARLDGNTTYTFPVCMISDHNPTYHTINGMTAWWSSERGRMSAQVSAPSANLNVQVCYAPEGRCFTASRVYNASTRLYTYGSCSQAIYTPGDPRLVPIPDSNGGVGVQHDITVRITNTSSQGARNITASVGVITAVEVARGLGYACTSQFTWPNNDYPWRWE